MRTRVTNWILPAIITMLALADGILHLRLISKLFGGKYWGSPSFGGRPPAGGFKMPRAIPFVSLPLNELFLLNCIVSSCWRCSSGSFGCGSAAGSGRWMSS